MVKKEADIGSYNDHLIMFTREREHLGNLKIGQLHGFRERPKVCVNLQTDVR